MLTLDLSRRVAVFGGFDNAAFGPLPREPESICTLDEFLGANPSTTWREISLATGWLRIGGGAAAEFTIKLLREGRPQ